MFTKKSIGAALGCALALGASGAAFAAPITVGGVTWDPSSGFDLKIQAIDLRETSVANVGDVLTGYGLIGSINGTGESTFCPGCNLTFTFSYTVSNVNTSGPNPQVVFTNGIANFYVDNTQSFSEQDPTTASIGTPWLTLAGHTAPFAGFSAIGQLYSTIIGPISQPGLGSAGQGLLDVVGGPAAGFVNTNTQADGSDFFLTSSFAFDPFIGCGTTPTTDLSNVCTYPIAGTAQLTGKTMTAVPEPGEIGLIGLGLVALGFLIRRRRKESEGQA
jgi:hypothetical protein